MPDDSTGPAGNLLSGARSPFLRHGATQPVHWRPWGEAAFREARNLGRPVLLDIGAVWCHWCHVMDHESYEDADTAAIINRNFIPVKVDRDEQPDVDARYQRAVQLLTGQGGWPLTAFLTPDGDVFFGGTYFPPVDAHGRPSFRRVLTEVARVWDEDPERARDAVRSIEERARSFAQSETQPGELSPSIPDNAIEALADSYDVRHGGFGRAPKFPNPAGLDLVLDHHLDTGDDWARRIVVDTIHAMGRGGVFDQIGGGFHRYSTDARWIIPHFEKMAYDNGPLLATCAKAAAAFDDEFAAEIADGIVAHYRDIAPDLVEEGGFPASQDADFGFDNDGDYWTWTVDELRAALDDDADVALARAAFGFDDDAGRMHLDRTRHVLFRPLTPEQVAGRTGVDAGTVRQRIEQVRARLKQARDGRPAPFVDTTLYAGWTALVAAGHITAARYVDRPDAGAAGLRALERVWTGAFDPDAGVRHRVGDAESGVVLEDQAYVLDAMLDAFEYTQRTEWLDRAMLLVAIVERRFRDAETGALRDRPAGDSPVRTLEQPLFPISDAPTPSGNGAAALALMRLAALTGEAHVHQLGSSVMHAFAGASAGLLASAGTYARAVQWAVRPVTTVVVVDDVESAPDSALFRAALGAYRQRTALRLIGPASVADAALPPALAAMVEAEYPRAYLCAGRSCAAPVRDPGSLRDLLRSFRGD